MTTQVNQEIVPMIRLKNKQKTTKTLRLFRNSTCSSFFTLIITITIIMTMIISNTVQTNRNKTKQNNNNNKTTKLLEPATKQSISKQS